MKNYKTNQECYNFYKDNLENKISLNGLSQDVFEALAKLYSNVNFHEVTDNATKRNNKLIFGEDNITFLNYSNKYFKSDEINPCFHRNKINLSLKMSSINIKEDIFKNCVDLKLKVKVSKISKVSVRYKILINNINYRYIEKFMRIYEMSKLIKS